MHYRHAKEVAKLLSLARRRVVIVSAFIRGETLSWLLKCIPKEVNNITIYARWRLNDILAGASDVSVINVARERNAVFKVYDSLHAKIYIVDGYALVGSANATNSGLGHSNSGEANLEILVKTSSDIPEINSVLEMLSKKSTAPIEFSEETLGNFYEISRKIGNSFHEKLEDNWMPESSPEAVLNIGSHADESVLKDCLALGIGCDISTQRLREIVRSRRLYKELEKRLRPPKNFIRSAEACQILSKSFSVSPSDVEKKWPIICAWMDMFGKNMYFLSKQKYRYELRLGKRIHFIGQNK